MYLWQTFLFFSLSIFLFQQISLLADPQNSCCYKKEVGFRFVSFQFPTTTTTTTPVILFLFLLYYRSHNIMQPHITQDDFLEFPLTFVCFDDVHDGSTTQNITSFRPQNPIPQNKLAPIRGKRHFTKSIKRILCLEKK